MERSERKRNSEGNSRLTAIIGNVLLPLFVVALITGQMAKSGALSAHVAVGLVIAAPIGVKLASVTYRMVSYYRGVAAYRERGRPSNALRLLGGTLGVLVVLLIGSGLALLVGPSSVHRAALSIHKVTAYLTIVALALHLFVHLRQALALGTADLRRRALKVSGRRTRWTLLSASLATGAVLAVLLTSRGGTYSHRYYPHNNVAMAAGRLATASRR